MKSKILILPLLLIVLMFGCENPSTQYSKPTPAQTYGSLTIGDSSESRVLDVSKILGAKVSVTGTGISNLLEKETTIKDGKVSGVIINNIPIGKNRIVTVKAATKGSEIAEADFIDSVVMRAVTDINPGANSVSVNWASTALGNVFHELLQLGYNISNITKAELENAIDTNVHATLINAKAIAEDFKAGTLKDKASYVLEGATVKFTVSGDEYKNYSVIVTDPASKETKVSASTITGITAGTWDFLIVNKETDMEWYRQTISVENGKTFDLGTLSFKTPQPKILPENLFFKDSLEITIKTENGSKVYYTKDGSDPTAESTKYTQPFTINADTVVKAFAVMEGLDPSAVVTKEYKIATLGYNYPENGAYSPVDQENWGTGTFSLGANIDSDGNGTFAVYSANATKMLLEIYNKAYGEDAAYDYWMEQDSDKIWRAKVKGITNGTLYAFRAWGPNWEYSEEWDRGSSSAGFVKDYDDNGNRFNPNKVLFDPYAKEISHDKSHPDVLAMVEGATGSDGKANPAVIYSTGGTNKVNGEASRNFDTGKYAPKAVVIKDNTSFGEKPEIPQEKAIIYEAHVRGITKHASSANLETILKDIKGFEAVKNIPTKYQGTYKGAAMLAHYLKALGVNTIELLPVHESDNDCNPDDAPGGNYWAYMTYGYFAPDRRYSYDKSLGGPTKEFKEMVKAFHDIGMEVYLDVVFNHSGEGGTWYGEKENDAYQTAELTFMRGLDNSSWYCIPSGNAGGYWETTGCGNNLQCDNEMVRKFIMNSLTYWIDEMGVDGYRFDLAPVIGRKKVGNEWVFNQSADTITEIADLGEEKDAEMIAEAWDCQYPGGYQVGNFPEGWGEWNGRYRDAIRSYVGTGNWNEKSVGDYIYGDEANFKDQGGPHKSVNFIVAHDGFTLADLCSYQGAGNAQNSTLEWPFGPSDGGNGDKNNLGFIDWTDENTQKASKRQAARNYIAIQMMSRGVPMIVWGDEFSRTQNGNNNPYNIDSVATWSNYNMINTSSPHLVATGGGGAYHNNFGTFASTGVNGNFMFMKNMLNLKANEPALNQTDYDSVKYEYSSPNEWNGATMVHIQGSKVSGGSDYLLCMNMTGGEVQFTLPAATTGKTWVRIADTQSYFESECNFWNPATIEATEISGSYGVAGWSVVILKEVAEREQVKDPTFTPADETFSGSTEVTISCATTGAEIYYTLDGSVPSKTNGTKFTSAIKLESTTTIKAIAVKDGAKPSEIVTKKYTNGSAVETPVLSVPAGDFWNSITVFVTCNTKEANIYYTTDGNEPTSASTAYNASKGIVISDNATLKVIACKSGLADSSVVSAEYTKQAAQSYTENKSGVMLQGFNWDSAPRGKDFNTENPNPKWYLWYGIMKKHAADMQKFEYVWLPPPSKTDTSSSEGYAPNELNNLNSCYGTEEELKKVIEEIKPAKAIADIVVNHRSGTTSWGDFTNPKWNDDYYSICSDDEGFSLSGSPMLDSSKKGAVDTGMKYDAYRDLDHTNVAVQQGIYSWMNSVLKRAGFVGWRYDYVKGFAGDYVGYYNAMTDAAFSVGEYWPEAGDGNWNSQISSWITATGKTINSTAGKQSRAFDFVLKSNLNNAFGWYKAAEGGEENHRTLWDMKLLANESTLMRSNPSAAVTFVDNHDTGSTQQHWELDWEDVPAAYAFILTHPGMPCVASQHYFAGDDFVGWQYRGGETVPGTEKTMRQHIDYLIQLRKEVGIEYDNKNALEVLVGNDEYKYVAKITGTKGEIIVKIGGDSYTPEGDGYDGNYPIYSGTNFAIWQKGEKGVAPADVNLTITASDDWLWEYDAVIFAWVWGGEYGDGTWVKATGSSMTINLTVMNDAIGLLFVRCVNGTTTPDWDIKSGDESGRIYNKSPDVYIEKGKTEYTVDKFTEYK